MAHGPGEVFDINDRPIYPGDLLRSFHFTERRYRRKRYLYHVAVAEGDKMRAVPTSHLEPAKRAGGGTFLLGVCNVDVEIIHGHGPGECLDFYDRPLAAQAPEGKE